MDHRFPASKMSVAAAKRKLTVNESISTLNKHSFTNQTSNLSAGRKQRPSTTRVGTTNQRMQMWRPFQNNGADQNSNTSHMDIFNQDQQSWLRQKEAEPQFKTIMSSTESHRFIEVKESMLPNRVLEFMTNNDLPIFIGNPNPGNPVHSREPAIIDARQEIRNKFEQLQTNQRSEAVMVDQYQNINEPTPHKASYELIINPGATRNYSQTLTPSGVATAKITFQHSRILQNTSQTPLNELNDKD